MSHSSSQRQGRLTSLLREKFFWIYNVIPVTQDMGVDIEWFILGQVGIGFRGNFLENVVDVGLSQSFASFRLK